MTDKVDTMVRTVAKALVKHVHRYLDPVLPELVQMEVAEQVDAKLKQFGFKGIWSGDVPYGPGAFVSHGGSSWVAVAETRSKPGTDDTWILHVKKGKDGRDAPGAR